MRLDSKEQQGVLLEIIRRVGCIPVQGFSGAEVLTVSQLLTEIHSAKIGPEPVAEVPIREEMPVVDEPTD